MIKMIKVSAPGKLMLFGDHAVVHNRPCIVTAVDHRISVSLNKRNDNKIFLNAPDMNIEDYKISIRNLRKQHPKKVRFVLTAIKNFFEKYKIESGLDVKTKSEFSSKFGLGSSSAVTVSTLKGLSELFGIKINNKELFDLSYKTVLDIQDVGSGFDVAAAIYGGTLYFVTGGKIIEPINIKELPLVVGYTGIKADTATLVKMLYRKLAENPETINKNFDDSAKIVDEARIEIQKNNWKRVGKLMNFNQELLRGLDVSSLELEKLISASKNVGAYGAKLSGAGGGDCMIAITDKENFNNVVNAIEKEHGTFIEVKLNAEGVRVEK
ncbi:MAG: mevalonate kinase [Candidatus Aenigmarchaeota archaeon]|nr:mevalonate kinase [Candidatus Aenigmarchaeota archaeon]